MSGTGIAERGLGREVNPPNLNSLNFPKDREQSGESELRLQSVSYLSLYQHPIHLFPSGFRSNDLFCIERCWKQDEKGPSYRDADTTWQNACLMFSDRSLGVKKEWKGNIRLL